MEKEEIATGIVVYKNVIDADFSLIEEIESAVNMGAIQWGVAYVRSDSTDEINPDQRDTQIIGVSYRDSFEEDLSDPVSSFDSILGKVFFEAFDPIERDYKNDFGFATDWHDSYGILKYGVGQKFTNHIDDHTAFHRRISFVYYANDDYEGGEINFPRFGVSYKPKANEMIVFPSTYVYNHSVSEVVSGTRYAVVSWAK